MTTVKVKSEDLVKAAEFIKKSPFAVNVRIRTECETVLLTFEDNSGKLVTVTLYSEGINSHPTVNKTERL